jgi:[protein-PII] uridylyltransferase
MSDDPGAVLREELLALLRAGTAHSLACWERGGDLARRLPELARLRAELRDKQGDRPWVRLAALAGLLDPRRDPAAAEAWRALPDPDGLVVACLVRAVGEGAGAERVRAVAGPTAERLGFGRGGRRGVARLAGEDADLAEVAMRTDVHDEEQVLRLAARLGSPERASTAYLLALAEDEGDGRAGWRRALLDELLRVVLAAMREPGLTDQAAERLLERRRAEVGLAVGGAANPGAAAWLDAAPRRYLLAQPAEAIARHLAMADPAPARRELRLAVAPEPLASVPAGGRTGGWRVDVVTRDRPGLLASLVGALSACDLDITRAQASTWPDDLVVDVFHVTGPAPDAEPGFPERVGGLLRRSVAGNLDTGRSSRDRGARLEPPEPPSPDRGARLGPGQGAAGPVVVRVDAGASPWHSTVRVEAPDRPGLLYEVLVELARHHVDVQVARVGGEAGRAVDLFLVTDAAGRPLERAAADRLGTALAGRLTGRSGGSSGRGGSGGSGGSRLAVR